MLYLRPVRKTEIIMGMPITIEIIDMTNDNIFEKIFEYFKAVDKQFSTYKKSSEVSKYNKGLIEIEDLSKEMEEVLKLSQQTKEETEGYFDIKKKSGLIDPSGIVKGWSIRNAALKILKAGYKNFFIEAGGDIEGHGSPKDMPYFKVGIRNPFDINAIVKVIKLKNMGIATSGTYIRGQHIYNPHNYKKVNEIASISVIGPNIYDADRFATASFAMGLKGINFIEDLDGFEAYMINNRGIATLTSGFERYVVHA